MLTSSNPFDQHVGARLLDFFGSRTPWHRALWSVGSVLALEEVLEAIEAVQTGVLADAALGFLVNDAQKLIGQDPGIGSVERTHTLQNAVKAKPAFRDLHYHVVAAQIAGLRDSYLHNWSAALAMPGHRLRAERTARAVASHLLDAGFSSDYLHRWWKYRLQHEEGTRTLSEVVLEAADLAHAHPREFDVLVVFESAADRNASRPAGLITSGQVSEWLKSNGSDARGLRQDGGLLFRVLALDPGVAAERASERLDRVASRVALGTRGRFKPHDRLWVRGETAPFRMERTHRGVSVRALEKEGQVHSPAQPNLLDAALELLAHLQISSPSAAVSGGWAAIEALLGDRGDRASAADRLAMLVACSYPRAELTALSYAIESQGGDIAAELHAAGSNRDRAAVVVRALTAIASEQALTISDQAALTRMRALIANPRSVLVDVQDHATAAFRRLYRQRNLVLHGGKTDAVALRASLRTAAPLVGAGFDRIVHAHYVDGLKPLEVAARAHVALATAGTSTGPSCVDLLG